MPVLRFIEPFLPSPADRPPSGADWIHEIKHDGYRLMARRDSVGIRLITRRGNDWSERFPLVIEAVNHLKVRSCLIDGEVVCCDERGLSRGVRHGLALMTPSASGSCELAARGPSAKTLSRTGEAANTTCH
jgi:ATP-dependent DNA ligase